jgi:ElaB/YqjD/DUF883 family membrane-anchored ribosome-binding protein
MNSTINSTIERVGEHDIAGKAREAKASAQGELRRLFDDVEELLGRVSYFNDVDLDRLRTKVEGSLRSARESSQHVTKRVRDASVQAATHADKYAHERPWTVVSLAVVAGLAIGAAVSARR